MNGFKNKPPGGQPGGPGRVADTLTINYPQYSSARPQSQELNNLLNQAAARMETDPARYGHHFLIWLSLHCLATGQEWIQ